MVRGMPGGTLHWAPMMPRECSLSRSCTPDGSHFFQSGVAKIYPRISYAEKYSNQNITRLKKKITLFIGNLENVETFCDYSDRDSKAIIANNQWNCAILLR